MNKTLWSFVGLLLGSWVIGVVFKLFEEAIHFLLVIAGVVASIAVALQLRRKSGGPDSQALPDAP